MYHSNHLFSIFYFGKIQIKITILSLQFNVIKYICVVMQLSPHSIHRVLFILQNRNSEPEPQ